MFGGKSCANVSPANDEPVHACAFHVDCWHPDVALGAIAWKVRTNDTCGFSGVRFDIEIDAAVVVIWPIQFVVGVTVLSIV